MSDQTTNQRAVEHLAVGDHISDAVGVHEVIHRFSFRNGDGNRMIAVTFRPLGSGQPWFAKVPEGELYHLATDDEIAEIADARRRSQFHDDLVAVQALLGATGARLSTHLGTTLNLHVVEGEVERLAEKLGLRPGRFGGEGSTEHAIEWTAPGDEDHGDRLRVKFWGRQAVKPEHSIAFAKYDAAGEFTITPVEAEQDWFFTFPIGSQYASRYVRIRGTEFSANKRMNLRFGHSWDQRYEVLPAEFLGLTELPESEWPAAPDDKLIEAVDRAFLPIRDEQQGR